MFFGFVGSIAPGAMVALSGCRFAYLRLDSHCFLRPAVLASAQIESSSQSVMTSAVRGFGPSEPLKAGRLLLMGAVCGLIVPCMAGLALSQKLHRWPVGEANFRIW